MWFLVIAAFILWLIVRKKNKKEKPVSLPTNNSAMLEQHVRFYQKLTPEQKKSFAKRVQDFLGRTAITGVGTTVTDLDRMLVAASAIIPIFAFPDWRYNNIDEVLLYPDRFNEGYEQAGENDRNILGMVGSGAMNRQMILSQPALRSGFEYNDGHNTGIHEFVHLLDKADGAVDGIPEYLLQNPYIIPWVNQMHEEIIKIRSMHSDIDLYGGTNDAEFFAVIAEYFFEKPEQLEIHHPKLYSLLEGMFRTQSVFSPPGE
ncbi:M90 family metallopeptidase [Taibaiella soli]|uniref:Peptidase n=1 Tax=Taibaiella soli TaxID=1649169 RepID=A0A2W2AU32_9BACT|nr:M90 family metallopeptidase [Taibaiella soli]PZF71218.1 peptidase [Taibaiella soli]